MRIHKYTFYITISVAVLLLALCLIMHSHELVYDISLACFGSSLVGGIMAIVGYLVERRRAMERFWNEVFEICIQISKIDCFDLREPEDLVINALNEELSNVSIVLSQEARENLISWMRENKHDFGYSNSAYGSMIMYDDALSDYRKQLRKCAKQYVAFADRNLRCLDDSYGELDFIFANKTIRSNVYYKVYNRIKRLHRDAIAAKSDFESMLSDGGNEAIALMKLLSMNRLLYKEVDGVYKPYCVYGLEDELDVISRKIYGKRKYTAISNSNDQDCNDWFE